MIFARVKINTYSALFANHTDDDQLNNIFLKKIYQSVGAINMNKSIYQQYLSIQLPIQLQKVRQQLNDMLNSICLFKISQFFITFKHNYNCNRERNSVKIKVLEKNKKDSNNKYYQAILVSTCTILQFKVIHGTIKLSQYVKLRQQQYKRIQG